MSRQIREAVMVLPRDEAAAPAEREVLPALALFLFCAAFFLYACRYAINTDATSYISIAQKYARGELRAAVNSIWQPLFSLLMAPFIRFGMDPLLAAKSAQVLGGCLCLAACARLALRLGLGQLERKVLLLTLVPVVLQFTFFTLTPDLLFAALIVLYFSVILDPAYPGPAMPALCGLIGGLAYLAKAYGLPFFAAHFCLMTVFAVWRKGRWKELARSLAAGYAVFFLIVGLWGTALSSKYGGFSLVKVFGFNASASLSGDWPISVKFRPPPDPTALSVWEDPSTIEMEKLPHLDAPSILKREAKKVVLNARDSLGIFKRFSPLSMAVMLAALALCCVPGPAAAWRRDPALAGCLFSALLLVAGYLPVNIETRYFWAALVLIVVIAFLLVSRLSREGRLSPPQKDLLLILVSVSFFAGPLFRMNYSPSEGQERLSRIAARLSAQGVTGRIASDSDWESTLYLAFFLGGTYYGEQQPGLPEEELRRQLDAYGIRYFFVWREGPVPAFLSGFEEVSKGVYRRLKVYRLR